MKATAGQGASVSDSTTKSNGASNQPDHEFVVPTGKSILFSLQKFHSQVTMRFIRW